MTKEFLLSEPREKLYNSLGKKVYFYRPRLWSNPLLGFSATLEKMTSAQLHFATGAEKEFATRGFIKYTSALTATRLMTRFFKKRTTFVKLQLKVAFRHRAFGSEVWSRTTKTLGTLTSATPSFGFHRALTKCWRNPSWDIRTAHVGSKPRRYAFALLLLELPLSNLKSRTVSRNFSTSRCLEGKSLENKRCRGLKLGRLLFC